jgi:hypothetical protein
MMSSGNENIFKDNKSKSYNKNMMKLRTYKPKMMQPFTLIVMLVICLSTKAQRAFVSADDDGVEATTLFGESFSLILAYPCVPVMFNHNRSFNSHKKSE